MANDNPKGASDKHVLDTFEEDEHQQWVVLRLVLELHPTALTQDEMIRRFTGGGSNEFSEVDAVGRAVRELADDGLLHPLGDDKLIRPTWAAVRYFELSGGAG